VNELITPDELFQSLSISDPPVIIDVRREEAYRAGHLPAAIHIPADEIAERMAEIPKERPVITY
jgi:rhodanese-related sulfurtransferase